MKNYENLIIVAGHAAFRDELTACPDDPSQDEGWVLQSFQQGEPPYYIEHIRKGAELLAEDPSSMLVFSGGRTRKEAGHWSEAASYAAVAEHFGYWSKPSERLSARVALEEHARDSSQNVEYGLYRFYQLTGRYPRHVTVAGWGFKAERFDLHRKALAIPTASFTYVSANDPADKAGAMRGEAHALEQFRADPFGAQPPLASKRDERNPFHETPSYDACPPIRVSGS